MWWSYGEDGKAANFVDPRDSNQFLKGTNIVDSIVVRLKAKEIHCHITQGEEDVLQLFLASVSV